MLSRLASLVARRSAARNDRDLLARARKFEHYWYNAQKKIDLRRLDRFGALAEQIRADGRT